MNKMFYVYIFIFVSLFVFLSLYLLGFRKRTGRKRIGNEFISRNKERKSNTPFFYREINKLSAFLSQSSLTGISPLISRLTGISDYSLIDFLVGCFISVLLFLSSIVILNSLKLSLILFIAGLAVPVIYKRWKIKKRDDAFLEQLPHVVDMISRGLRAGQSMDDALREVAKHFDAPAGDEIKRVYEEMAMGVSFETAIRNFEQRYTRVADIKLLCTAFIIQRETGGNLAVTLDKIGDTIRQRFNLYRQIKALSADGRLSALIIGLLPIGFGVFTFFFRPDYIGQLFFTPAGKSLLFTAVMLELIGVALMARITRIKI